MSVPVCPWITIGYSLDIAKYLDIGTSTNIPIGTYSTAFNLFLKLLRFIINHYVKKVPIPTAN